MTLFVYTDISNLCKLNKLPSVNLSRELSTHVLLLFDGCRNLQWIYPMNENTHRTALIIRSISVSVNFPTKLCQLSAAAAYVNVCIYACK